jgi:hypothetical protein
MRSDERYLAYCIIFVLVLAFVNNVRRRSYYLFGRGGAIPLHLVRDEAGNESLVIESFFKRGESTLFLIDTAYAGAPVMSLNYLSGKRGLPVSSEVGSVQDRYKRTVTFLRSKEIDTSRAVHDILYSKTCRAFQSGCTMRLMGIGETAENQADLLLCPPLLSGISSVPVPKADIFVTNPLAGSIHILTMDYLLHRSPAILMPNKGKLELAVPFVDRMAKSHSFEFFTPTNVGGSFVVPITVGGTKASVVIDTGSSATLSLSPKFSTLIKNCEDEKKIVNQVGVNGEKVCSTVLKTDIRLGNFVIKGPVLVNTLEVQGADGYAGMGLLRAFDVWLEPGKVGFRLSGLPVELPSSILSEGKCTNVVPMCKR